MCSLFIEVMYELLSCFDFCHLGCLLEELCDCSMNCRENPNSGLGSKILKLIVACREAKETLQVEVSQVNFLKNLMASAQH